MTLSHDRAQPSQPSHTRWPSLSPFRWERGEALVGPRPSPPASHLALSLVSAPPTPAPCHAASEVAALGRLWLGPLAAPLTRGTYARDSLRESPPQPPPP